MILMLTAAIALQSGPPLLQDSAFLAAHEAWAACTNRVVDADYGSPRSETEIVAAAFAACTAEQEAVRARVFAFAGEAEGRQDMATIIDGNREGLADRVRERRRRAAAVGAAVPQDYRAASLAWAQCTKNRIDAAPRGGRDADIIDAAFAGCTSEEAAVRAAAVRMLGNETQADHLMSEGRTIARDTMRNYLRGRR